MTEQRRMSVAELLAQRGKKPSTDQPARRHRAREGARSVRELTGSFRAITDEDLAAADREEGRSVPTERLARIPVPVPSPQGEVVAEDESTPSAASGLSLHGAEDTAESVEQDTAATVVVEDTAAADDTVGDTVDETATDPTAAAGEEATDPAAAGDEADVGTATDDTHAEVNVVEAVDIAHSEADTLAEDSDSDGADAAAEQPLEVDTAPADGPTDTEVQEDTAVAALSAEDTVAQAEGEGSDPAPETAEAWGEVTAAEDQAQEDTWAQPDFNTGSFATATFDEDVHTGQVPAVTDADRPREDTVVEPIPAEAKDVEDTPAHPADEVDFTVDESAYQDDVAPPTPWWMLILYALGGLVAGAAVFYGFSILWSILPIVALILAILVIAGLLVLATVLSPGGKMSRMTLVLFALAGIVATFGPLIRLQL